MNSVYEDSTPLTNINNSDKILPNNQVVKNKEISNVNIKKCKCSFLRIPLFCCFLTIIGCFLFVLIFALFLANYFMMKNLYSAINDNYFSKEIIDPIINRNANFTQAFNIRIKALDDVYLKSKLLNVKFLKELCIDDKLSNCYNTMFLNFEQKFHIKEIAIKDNNNESIYNERSPFMQDFLNSTLLNTTLEEADGNDNSFKDYVVANKYQNDTFFNYIKLFSYRISNNVTTIVMRMDSDAIINLYNKQGNNLTTIMHVTDISTTKQIPHIYNIGSDYLSNLFEYGFKHTYHIKTNDPLTAQFAVNKTFITSEVKTFFNLTYMSKEENFYNKHWYNEIALLGQIIYYATKQISENNDISEYLPLEYSCTNKNLFCKIAQNITVYPFDMSTYTFSDISSSINNEDFITAANKSNTFYNQNKYGNAKIQLNNSIFTNGVKTRSPTKILIYNQNINNFKAVNIELMDVKLYASIKEEFIDSMEFTRQISNIILVVFCIVAYIASLLFLSTEINKTIQRIKAISMLKNLLFCKKGLDNLRNDTNHEINGHEGNIKVKKSEIKSRTGDEINKEMNNSARPLVPRVKHFDKVIKDKSDLNKINISNDADDEKKDELNIKNKNEIILNLDNSNNQLSLIIEKKNHNKILNKRLINSIERWDKKNIYQKDFFKDGNKLIIQFTYKHLISVLENIDNFSAPKFNEKLRFLQRKYKLHKEQEGKNDCQLASDIYKAISRIDMFNLRDVSYNVHYNYHYLMNQNFRMFKGILQGAENKKFISLKNNKFINFEDLMKIIYHIKKDKIQALVNNIFEVEKPNENNNNSASSPQTIQRNPKKDFLNSSIQSPKRGGPSEFQEQDYNKNEKELIIETGVKKDTIFQKSKFHQK